MLPRPPVRRTHAAVDRLDDLMIRMGTRDGVITVREARVLGLRPRLEDRLVAMGVLERPAHGLVALAGLPHTWHRAARIATSLPGSGVLAGRSALRLHALDTDRRRDDGQIDVLRLRGAATRPLPGVAVRWTRSLDAIDVAVVDELPVLTPAATLVTLEPFTGTASTWRALRTALDRGVPAHELRATAERWRSRGRSGPGALALLLDEVAGRRLHHSWFRRVAGEVERRTGVRLGRPRDPSPPGSSGATAGRFLLASAVHRVGVAERSWPCPLAPDGWVVIETGWRDATRPGSVVSEVLAALRCRAPAR